MPSFSWFEKELRTVRKYIDDSGVVYEWKDENRKKCRSIKHEFLDGHDVFAGSHVMNSPGRGGLEVVEAEFDVELPGDMKDFYKRWDGGFLLLGTPYHIWSTAEILEKNERLRDIRENWDDDWSIIRFGCFAGGKEQVALCMANEWGVIYAPYEYNDKMILSEEMAPLDAYYLASSFSEWLKETIKADGAMPPYFGTLNPRLA